MKGKHNFLKKLISVFLCLQLVLTHMPILMLTTFADKEDSTINSNTSTSIADPKTLSDWEKWFPTNSNRYSGGVFLDKSVYTASEAKTDNYFKDISADLSFGQDNFGNENFMIALSALGSNSEVKGYTYTPTDTMLVLDASTSMGTGSSSSSAIDDMVEGANEAIKSLLSLNNHNRVGIVIYNGTASVLLPLDHYETTNINGNILEYSRQSNQNRIYIASNVTDSTGGSVTREYIAQAQGTYTQGGIYAAAKEFMDANPIIEEGKIQAGTYRIPIMVLMSDGEPSYRTQTGTNLTINKYTSATNDNCDRTNFREDEVTAFSTMLTAAWAEEKISSHYNNDARFYTLGYNLTSGHQYAHNVLDPMNPNNSLASTFKSYADQYLAMNKGETERFNNGAFRVTKANDDEVTSLDYVDRYWQASNENALTDAFDSIVEEIIIQSRYYSTLVTSNNYQQDGFISFTDEIGTHMEVKNVKGIYIGEAKLVTGGMFAEFATTGKVEDYDNENYSAEQLKGFENEILSAIEERFNISTSEAALLIDSANTNGFISYTSPDEFSNYIAWYANENNEFIAPYSASGVQAPSNAKYIVRSYFYMGDVKQSHVETSMLYALVRVREDIQTGRQIVDMNVPAALLPMVTYTITVEGDELTEENIKGMTCEQKNPISLLYEVGLDSEINPINLSEKMEGQDFRKDANGVYTFYTNRWRADNGDPFEFPKELDPHIFNHGIMNTTVTQFIPSLENERFYYTENLQILDSNYNVYTGSSKPTGDGYYVEYNWIENNGNSITLETTYNPIPSSVFGIDGAIIKAEGQNSWFIKKGTPQFYFGEEVHGEQAHSHKVNNITNTLGWSDYPQIAHHSSEGHTGYHMLNYHGNNGLVKVTPTQGIKITKTVSTVVNGASNTFGFKIKLNDANLIGKSYPLYIEHADSTTTNKNVIVGNDGTISLELKAGDIAYITDIPAGTEYEVTENYNSHYTASATNASGTIGQYIITPVDFVNSPRSFGSLLVEKDVTHPFDTISSGLASKEFNIKVTFTGTQAELNEIIAPAIVTTTDNGTTYTMKLKDGEDALFTNIPEGVNYKVEETDIPTGFTLTTNAEKLNGTISKDNHSEVMLVNDYNPLPVSPNITISGEKNLNGRNWDSSIDKYQVELQRVEFGGQDTVAVGKPVSVDITKNANADYTIDMSNITYDKVGTYSYAVYEVFPGEEGRVDNVSYDTSFAMFSVTVVDDGSGTLKVNNVVVHQNTATISGNSENGWNIVKDFTNNYNVKTVTIPVVKNVIDNNNIEISGYRGGIMMALYETDNSNTPVYSTLTNENGDANFIFAVAKDEYSTEKYFYLREVVPLVDSQVVGMTYDTSFKYVIGVKWSNTDTEPTVKYYRYDANTTNGIGEEITDSTTENTLPITNKYDNGVTSNGLEFSGTKTVNGGTLRNGDSFTFELYQTDATFNIDRLTPLQIETVSSENGEYAFDTIDFRTVGTKYLVVVERQGNTGGITYDNTVYHITIDVSKELENNKTILKAETTHIHKVGSTETINADGLDFDNTYRINGTGSVIIEGNKTLTGRNLVEGEFTFEIFEEGRDTPLYTTTNASDGSFVFPEIKYNILDGESLNETYTYIVKERIPDDEDKKGITYSQVQYKVVVTLSDDNEGGIAKDVVITLNGSPVENIKFENTYSATSDKVTIGGTKTLENKDSGVYTINLYETGKDFAITNNNPVKSATADVTKDNGKYSIDLTYSLENIGYHYYLLEEYVPGDTKGIQYDATKYYITINAIDNGHGEVEAHISRIICPYNSETYTTEELNFTNKYFTEPTEYIIKGTKILENKELEADMFEFSLSDDVGEIETVKNNKDGSFEFSAQAIEKPGIYKFYISEKIGDNLQRGINYDRDVYTITVPVYDDGEGSLKVDEKNISITRESGDLTFDEEEVVFTNIYIPNSSDEIYIEGIKYLEGKELEKNEFEFELYKADENLSKGELIATTKNTSDGKFKFDADLIYDDAGKYYYIITEKNTGNECITYDDTIYAVIVTVNDDEGKFVVSEMEIGKVDENSINDVETIEFNNIFTPKVEEEPEDPKPEPEPEPEPQQESKPEPEKDNPKTGDNITLFVITFVISIIGLFVTMIIKKKNLKTM